MSIKNMIVAAGLAALGFAGVSGAQVLGGDYHTQGSSQSIEVIAGEFRATGLIEGDIEGIAGDIDIDATVEGDIEVVGGDVNIAGDVEGYIETAGGDIDIEARVGGQISAFGGDVRFSGHGLSGLEMAGGHVELTASSIVEEDVNLAGDEVVIAGTVRGDVEVLAAHLRIESSAVIEGTISLEGPREAIIEPGATLTSPVDYTYEDFDFSFKHLMHEMDIVLGVIGMAIFAGSVLFGMLLIAILPNWITSVSQSFRRRPAVSGLVGLIMLAMLPVIMGVLSGILAATIVGIPLVALMWILYLPMHYVAFTLGVIAFGDLLLNRGGSEGRLGMGMRIISLLVAAVVLSALAFVPLLGVLIGFLTLWIGLGAWTLSIFDKESTETAPLAAAAPAAAASPVVEADPVGEPASEEDASVNDDDTLPEDDKSDR
ncbi:MAG: polymer-forming cytoskeletal protein [Maricaulis sp.]|jgi:cytoskeletal protein CcmA (bactofilin family)|nr:polymer-forming cytoskeletal protein [Maricaulis sp.]